MTVQQLLFGEEEELEQREEANNGRKAEMDFQDYKRIQGQLISVFVFFVV